MAEVVEQSIPIPGRAIAAVDTLVPAQYRRKHSVPPGTLTPFMRLHVDAPAPDRMYVVFTTQNTTLVVTIDDSRQVECRLARFRRLSISKTIQENREDD